MESNVFKYILKNSKREQFVLLIVTAMSFPFLYFSLDLPKTIINKAIGGSNFPSPFELFGFKTEAMLDQLPFLWILCGLYLLLVCVNGGFKYGVNVLKATLSERMLRRLRYHLINRVLRFPLPHFRGVSSGALVSMVAAETEPLGGFSGDAYSVPAFQGGTLLTLLVFMFVQDPVLGAAAIALYPVQAYLIPKLQRRVNLLAKERVRQVRQFSEGFGEMVSGIGDIHAHGTAHYELARFSDRLGKIYNIRYDIYRKKFFIKFLNNFLGQLTPFFFFSIGGYLVITGGLTLGALVAVLAAYKDLSAPWKELLAYYQRLEDARIKYDQLVDQFHPAGLMDDAVHEPTTALPKMDGARLSLSNVSLEEEEGVKVVSGVTLSVGLDEHVALSGPDGGGRTELARLLARQLLPTSGNITLGDLNLANMTELVTGRTFSYVDNEAYVRQGTVRENLLYGLKHLPIVNGKADPEVDGERKKRQHEAIMSGNSQFDVGDDWLDYEALGVSDDNQLSLHTMDTLRAVQLEEDVFLIGLRRVVDPDAYPGLADSILEARQRIRGKLEEDPELAELVEVFDVDAFNNNASVAENILFGTPLDDTFDIGNLGRNEFVTDVLKNVGLIDQFPELGRAIATLMVELFRDLPPGHEFLERFSFIQADDLPEYQRILNSVAQNGIEKLSLRDRSELTDLPFKLVPARHRLGFIDDTLTNLLLNARKVFAETIPDHLRDSIAFFDTERYNAAISLQDNILFGKIATHKAESGTRIGELLAETIDDLGLRDAITDVGLEFDVGIGGKRLTPGQRQKLAIARCLIKRPSLLIVNEPNQGLNAQAQQEVYEGVRRFMKGRGLVWVQGEVKNDHDFDRIISIERGRVAESEPSDTSAPTEPVSTMVPEEDSATSGLASQTELLASIPFFAGLDRSKLKLMAFTSEVVDFSEGQDLLRQGDSGDSAFVILQGTLDIIIETSQGPSTVAQVGRGALIGELALLCDTPRTATVRATGPVSALNISKDVFFQLIQENAVVAFNLTRMVADRLATAMQNLSGPR